MPSQAYNNKTDTGSWFCNDYIEICRGSQVGRCWQVNRHMQVAKCRQVGRQQQQQQKAV